MNFHLERWNMDYMFDLAENANNSNISDKLRDAFPYPYTIDDARFFINYCIQNDEKNQLCRAIIVDNHAVGNIGVFFRSDVYSKSAEIGYWLSEKYWGKGIMSQAIKQMCKFVFDYENDFDIYRIFAEPFADNHPSRKVLENSGFKLEGIMKSSIFKNGELKDSCMYALLKNCSMGLSAPNPASVGADSPMA